MMNSNKKKFFCFFLVFNVAAAVAVNTFEQEMLAAGVDAKMEYLFRTPTAVSGSESDFIDDISQHHPQQNVAPTPIRSGIYPDMPRAYQPVNLDAVLSRIRPRFHPPQATFLSQYYLYASPFFIELRFGGFASSVDRFKPVTMEDYFFKKKRDELIPQYFVKVPYFELDNNIRRLREKTLRRFAATSPQHIAFNVDRLPDVTDLINFRIDALPIQRTVTLGSGTDSEVFRRIERERVRVSPWTNRANAMLQFSQNFISDNWYQGGSNNTSILGVVNGRFNFDNKKGVQWENFVEWRLGFNSVEGDTLRFLNTNDDILRASSKIGIRAGGDWFYSSSLDFQTQFFNSYRSVNSNVLRTTFLTPVRFNVGVGMDYKYKRTFSMMIAPVSYRFIYASDTVRIHQRSFGIPRGKKALSELGSSIRLEYNYGTYRDFQINSKLRLFTNYERFEIDLEVTGNFVINRYLSTRISLNPRYDNTVYLAGGEKAKIQYRQLITFGLSYRLL